MNTIEILGANRFPGISCAYRDAAGREILKFSGDADKENGIRVDGNTVFPACSISKFITALTVMKLQEQIMEMKDYV